MSDIQTILSGKVSKYLPWIERFFLAALVVGASLSLAGMPAEDIIFVSLSTLSVVYFLNAFRPPQDGGPDAAQEPMGFRDLLASSIIPKVLWISCSTSIIGILFTILRLEGHEQMLMIGGSSTIMGIFLLGFISIGGTKHLKELQPVLMRAVPIAIITVYIFLK
jgi:hypothetical protein